MEKPEKKEYNDGKNNHQKDSIVKHNPTLAEAINRFGKSLPHFALAGL
jgi:hypothetical protein